VPESRLLDVITMCDSVVLGAALDLAAPDPVWDVDQARNPALLAAIQQAGSRRERSDRPFELALDLLGAGIAALVDGRSARGDGSAPRDGRTARGCGALAHVSWCAAGAFRRRCTRHRPE
jgi:hypothetical protein